MWTAFHCQFELEREKLELELQEEKKAQVDRERRIKEQERKIENLSTMVISSAVDDRDQVSMKVESHIVMSEFLRLHIPSLTFSFQLHYDNSLLRAVTFGSNDPIVSE